MKHKFTASIWKEDTRFIAQCLEVDVASQGVSENEALDNLRDALELHFESPSPKPTTRIVTFEVDINAA
jgi:predicted RNase H-like HicB family nuclease